MDAFNKVSIEFKKFFKRKFPSLEWPTFLIAQYAIKLVKIIAALFLVLNGCCQLLSVAKPALARTQLRPILYLIIKITIKISLSKCSQTQEANRYFKLC